MAVRTDSDAVKAILLLDYDSVRTPDLSPFIEAASAIVDDVVTCATEKGTSINSTRQELVERWLSAHFYKQSDKEHMSSSNLGASASFAGQTAMGFMSTRYGQMACRLDSTGCLDNIDQTQEVSLDWLGLPPSEQTDYDQRD